MSGIGFYFPPDLSGLNNAVSAASLSAAQAATAAAIRATLPTSITAGGTLPNEVSSLSGGPGTGAGGVTGTYAGGVTGGPAGFAWTYDVSGGAVTKTTITNPGLGTSTAAPTLSYPGGGFTTPPTVPTATVSAIAVGRQFFAPSADGTQLLAWGNNAGAVASAPFGGTQLSLPIPTGVLAAITDQIKRAAPAGRNLFNPATALNGSCVQPSDGTTRAASGYFATDLIPVLGLAQIALNFATPDFGNNNAGYAWYDNNKARISGGSGPIAAGALAVPAGAAFFAATFYGANTPVARLMIVAGATLPANYRAFGAPEQFSVMLAALRAGMNSRPRKANYFDPSAPRPVGVPRVDTGVITNVNDTGYTTAIFPVEAGKPFVCTTASQSIGNTYGLVFLDKDANMVGAVACPFAAGQVFTPPADAVVTLFPTYKTMIPTLLILPQEITPGSLASHTPAFLSDAGGQWAGKNIGQSGDSISANKNPVQIIATACTALGANFALDGTLAGRMMKDALKKPDGTPFVQADVAPLDAYNIYLGTNDFTGVNGNPATPIGSISDTSSATSFIGLLKAAIEQLLTWKPTLHLSVSILLFRNDAATTNSLGNAIGDYSAAIRSVAALYALPVLDLERTSGINAFNASTTMVSPHPNPTGTSIMVGKLTGFYRGQNPAVAVS